MKRLRVILGAFALVFVLALPAGMFAAPAGAGAAPGGALASFADRSKIGQRALVVGIGEQHATMFGDPRF